MIRNLVDARRRLYRFAAPPLLALLVVATVAPLASGIGYAGTSPVLVDATPAGVTHPNLLAASGANLLISDDGPMYNSNALLHTGSQVVSLDTGTGVATTVSPTGWYAPFASGAQSAWSGYMQGLAATSTGLLFTDESCGGGVLFSGGTNTLLQKDFPPFPVGGGCTNEYQRLQVSPDEATVYAIGGPNFGGATGGGYDVWTKAAALAGDTYGLGTDPTSPNGYAAGVAGNDAAPPTGTGALIDAQLVGNRLVLAYTSGIAVQTLDGSSCATGGAASTFCALTAFGDATTTGLPANGSPLSTPAVGAGNNIALHLAVDGLGDAFILTYAGSLLEASVDGTWHVIAGGITPAAAGQPASASNFGFNPGGVAVVGSDLYVSGFDAGVQPHVWKIAGVASPGGCAASSVQATPTTVSTGGSQSSLVSVRLCNGSPEAGHTVSLTPNSGSSAVVATVSGSGTTDATGLVQFRVIDNVAEAVTLTAKDLTTGVTLSQTVTVTFVAAALTPTVTLTPDHNPAVVGDQVKYTVTVSGSTPAPTGTVTFTDNGSFITGCVSAPLPSTGAVTCTAPYASTAGSPHSIVVHYSGDTNYAAGSATLSETVQTATPTVTLTPSGATTVNVGDQVTYTVVVSGNAATPTGTVTLYDQNSANPGGAPIAGCDQLSLAGGVAQCVVTYPATDGSPHQISASYGGDANYASAGSSTTTVTVQALSGMSYVALGDSYSAGEGDGYYGYGSQNNSCDRSAHAYGPYLDQDASLGPMAFVACSGAITDDLFNANREGNGEPAQLCGAPGVAACPPGVAPRLGTATRTVTLTIGGNDIGFSDVLSQCVQAAVPNTSITVGGGSCLSNKPLLAIVQARINALGGKGTAMTPSGKHGSWPIHSLSQVLATIHAAAPNAQVYIAVYPALFGTFKGTTNVGTVYANGIPLIPGTVPLQAYITSHDAQQLDAVGLQLDSVIAAAALAAGPWATPVNDAALFAGHGYDSASPWFNALAANVTWPSQAPYYIWPGSFHPNDTGQRSGFEAAFLKAMGL